VLAHGALGMSRAEKHYKKLPKISRADILPDADKSMGSTPGVETPSTPDGPVVLDAGDVVEGLWVGGLRRVGR
jgi:hypothetical protein